MKIETPDILSSLNYLRKCAVDAHSQGDGLLTANLCQIAIQEFSPILETQSTTTSVQDFAWVIVFQNIWLLSIEDLITSDAFLKFLEPRNKKDELLLAALKCQNYLIRQPLDRSQNLSEKISEIEPSLFHTDYSQEISELYQHLVELLWFRTVKERTWRERAKAWATDGPPWLKNLCESLCQRLDFQSRLTNPGGDINKVTEHDIEEASALGEGAELWFDLLIANHEQIQQRVESLAARSQSDTFKWRQLADYWRISSIKQNRDLDSLWFSRRRLISSEFPLTIFHEERKRNILSMRGELFRKDTVGAANLRFKIWQMSMLHEIAALRLWDYWMWLEAIEAQTETSIESGKWENSLPSLTVNGIATAARTGIISKSDEDTTLAIAIKSFEFLDKNLLNDFFIEVLNTYPINFGSVAQSLTDLSEFIPPDLLPEIIDWTILYVENFNSNPFGGSRLFCFGYLTRSLHEIDGDSRYWSSLYKLATGLSNLPPSWRETNSKGFLSKFIRCAPEPFARRLLEQVIKTHCDDINLRISRLEFILEAHKYGYEFTSDYLTENLQGSSSPYEGFFIRFHFGSEDSQELQKEAKQFSRNSIFNSLSRIETRGNNSLLSSIWIPPLVNDIDRWDESDLELVDKIAMTIGDSSDFPVIQEQLLSLLQLIVSKGNRAITKCVLEHCGNWISNQLRPNLESLHHGPFSMIQVKGLSDETVFCEVGDLMVQLIENEPSISASVFEEWKSLKISINSTACLLCTAMAHLALVKRNLKDRQSNWSQFKILSTAILERRIIDKKHEILATQMIRHLTDLQFRSSKGGEFTEFSANELFPYLEFICLQFHDDISGLVRSSVAKALSFMEESGELNDELADVLSELKTDNRNSVRYFANGRFRTSKR